VAVGVHDYRRSGDGEHLVRVQAIIQHPRYKAGKLRSNDFTLLKLAEPVDGSEFKNVGIACLPTNMTENLAGADMVISGWKINPGANVIKLFTAVIYKCF